MRVEGYRVHRWGGELRWEGFEVPPPGPGEALVQVEACGIGLTVLNCIRGDLGNDPALLPRVPGHELVGRVAEVGAGVQELAPGQRVMAYFYLACGTCHTCRSGRDSLCQALAGYVGVYRDGGYAPYTVLPTRNLLPLSESIPSVQATVIPDAVATPLHVCKTRARVRPGDRVAVIGAGGGVGIHMIQMARLFGAEVAGLERAEEKLPAIDAAGGRPGLSDPLDDLDPGALWGGRRPSVVIDLVGTPKSLSWGAGALGVGGRLVVLTTFPGVQFPVAPQDLVFGEVELLGSRYAWKAELQEAAELVEAGRIQPIVGMVVPPREVHEVHGALQDGSLLGRGALDWTKEG